ncbi:MAG: hypothetical protein A3F09_03635 [Chlamydiae bacterium RIFCSPHIGHO2_12_FULL_49_11]|nr:MAG: hypothetical protein A3F09_03635 [Chlamydiae bacterium RIFCSPHIGHO2_12_FULL_49_11]
MRNSTLLLFLFLFGCSSSDPAALREEGKRTISLLTEKLATCDSVAALELERFEIEELFQKFVHLMILQKKRELRKGKCMAPLSGENLEISAALQNELVRLYRLPGGRKVLEEMQEEPARRLDRFYSRLKTQVARRSDEGRP